MTSQYRFTSALVNGASSGIGESMVRLLADSGVPQVIVAGRVDRLEEVAAAHANIEVLAADLTTDDGMRAIAARVASEAEPIDLVVNNAGFGTSGR